MAVNLSPIWGAGAQLLDNSGNVLSGGKIYTYAAGTTTPATTYTSSSGITANSNPIILNSAGRVPYEIWLSDTLSYKFVLKDSNDTLIATYDNLTGINSNFIAYTAQQEIQTATAGQTVFNLTTMQYQPNTNNLSVFVDGVNQYGPGAQYAYVETDSDTVTFVSGLHVGASVKFTTASPVSSSSTNAANVAYDPPFTGAVTTNVEAKLAQTVSVKDFGATGDGVTDDTQAFEDALAASDTVVVPANGTYVVKLADIPSNKTIIAYGAVLLNDDTGNTGIFSIAAGVSNVTLLGGSYRGPAYNGTPVPAPAYPASNGCIRILGTYNNVCSDITIKDVEIAGWNDYGIFAENVLRGTFNNNHIHTIGRDGVRTYGAVMTDVSHNHIHDITPGYSGVAPNLNAYGITFTRNSTNVGTPLVNHPPSSFCTANNNLIEDIPTWKGLDTHGGRNIIFSSNIVRNCRFGVGIDEGDTTGVENAPPINITVADNILNLGSGNAGAAGINVSSSSASNRGDGVVITGNTIVGFGGSSSGAINVAYNDNIQIIGNTLVDSAYLGINFAASATSEGALIDSNLIKDMVTPVAAIAVQSATVEGFIKGGSFVELNGTAFTAISLASPSAGYGFGISDDLHYHGSVTKWAASALGRIQSGGALTQAKAYASVQADGTLELNYNIASATKDSTGVYTVVLDEAATSVGNILAQATARALTARFISCSPTDASTIKVYCFNSSGVAADVEFVLTVYGI